MCIYTPYVVRRYVGGWSQKRPSSIRIRKNYQSISLWLVKIADARIVVVIVGYLGRRGGDFIGRCGGIIGITVSLVYDFIGGPPVVTDTEDSVPRSPLGVVLAFPKF